MAETNCSIMNESIVEPAIYLGEVAKESSLSPSLNTSAELKSRSKLKKDALEFVDYIKEYQHDPKYKTELCKSWSENGFCAYGNKCRFAHGRQELFDKVVNCKKYKQKECMSFFKNNYCCYGSRCHFKHEERRLSDIERSYFTYIHQIMNSLTEKDILESDLDVLTNFLSEISYPPKEFSRLPNLISNLRKDAIRKNSNRDSLDSHTTTSSRTSRFSDDFTKPFVPMSFCGQISNAQQYM